MFMLCVPNLKPIRKKMKIIGDICVFFFFYFNLHFTRGSITLAPAVSFFSLHSFGFIGCPIECHKKGGKVLQLMWKEVVSGRKNKKRQKKKKGNKEVFFSLFLFLFAFVLSLSSVHDENKNKVQQEIKKNEKYKKN